MVLAEKERVARHEGGGGSQVEEEHEGGVDEAGDALGDLAERNERQNGPS
eukprot:CAMPEP_0198661998 /NCGR_PEP_ID=MMETSP1467-20131203/45229_1 /TAXON_ID=1462469 /ORGANISM="unid. sp., Strain CCMP2135" /LENGTH=49 /DNA_ID= /DNA_START= /DNA_END= /DNA_ORIENTATION=